MPNNEQQTEKEKSLSQLIAGALMEISPETTQAINNHPDSSALAERVTQVLGVGQSTDAMSPQARLRYLEATGADINAQAPITQESSTETTDEDAANIARLKAISDLAVEAQKQATAKKSTAPRQQEGMVEGLAKLLKKSLEESLAETKSDIKLLKDAISTDIQKRMK